MDPVIADFNSGTSERAGKILKRGDKLRAVGYTGQTRL